MEIDTLAHLIVNAEKLRKIYKRFPAYKEAVSFFKSLGSNAGVVHDQFALSGNQKVIELVIFLAEMEKLGLRKHSTLQFGAQFLGNGLTDLYTYGNGPCFILLVNRQAMIHIPLNLDYIQGLSEVSDFRLSETAILRNQLDALLHRGDQNNDRFASIRELIFFPGESWSTQEGEKFAGLLTASYPGCRVNTHLPSNHAVWLGNSHKKPGIVDYAAVDINRGLLFKSF